MSNPIKDKATEWWQLISNQETADAYKSFFQLTWKILKETALLVWLILCFGLVSIGWVWNNSSKVTESVSDLRTKSDPNSNVMAEAAVKLWEASRSGASNAMTTARKQLDLPEQPPKAPKAAKTESAKSPSGKTPEQYAQEQAAKDAAAAKAKAEAEAKTAQEKVAQEKDTADAGEASEAS